MSGHYNTVNEKGQFVRIHPIVDVCCPCGINFKSTQDRQLLGRGKYCSKVCMYKYRKEYSGESHHKWSGDKPKYSALHKWVAAKLGKPMKCEWCGFKTNNKNQIQWANKSGEYRRDIKDWLRLCAKCHWHFDREGVKNV